MSREVHWFTDSSALERLFLTVLDNAVKYTAPGGHVAVRSELQNGNALIEIEDTGMGIAAGSAADF